MHQGAKRMSIRRTIRKGFTLVEILIVVVILGILAAIVVPQFTNATQDAQAGNIKAQLDTLNNQIELYRARNNAYPDIADNWDVMIEGGYIKAAPKNPFNGLTTTAGDAAEDGWQLLDLLPVGEPDGAWDSLGATNFDEENGVITPGEP
jgi:general secretion pathway protein G